jgi:hypothetical protein
MPIATTLVGALLGRGFDGAFGGGFVGFIARAGVQRLAQVAQCGARARDGNGRRGA